MKFYTLTTFPSTGHALTTRTAQTTCCIEFTGLGNWNASRKSVKDKCVQQMYQTEEQDSFLPTGPTNPACWGPLMMPEASCSWHFALGYVSYDLGIGPR